MNKRIPYGWSSLHLAVHYGNVGVVRSLLQHGANANDEDELGRTALHLVSSIGITLTLLEHGADVDARDREGARPLETVSRIGYHNVAQLLSKRSTR